MTCSPAARSASGTTCRPRFSSVEKTSGLSGEGEFATDRFFDLCAFATIILRQRVHRVACLISLGEDGGRNSRACNGWPAKGNEGVDHHKLGLVRSALSCEWVQPRGQP